jgi:hypothetical protein
MNGTLSVTDNITCSSVINCQSYQSATTTLNIGTGTASNNINIGSVVRYSTVNINSLNTNITGILTINGYPYIPASSFYNSSTGYFNQFGY